MKCPNCNAEIKEGSIICPVCNTQFAFTGSDNYINLPDDDYVIQSSGVEEYVDPYEGTDHKPEVTPGSLNLKTNKAPKKVIKKVVKVTTKPVQEEAVEISPSVNFDKNDEVTIKEDPNLETTVVNVGGFTNTIVDATSAMKEEEKPKTQSVTTSNMPQVSSPVDPGVFAPTTNQATGVQLIQDVNVNTDTIGQVTTVEENKDEKKPRKKMSETAMIAFIMGLILILLCFIIYILMQNNNNPNNVPTTTTMTTFNCEENDCSTTTTTTTEATTTTKPVNQGIKTSLDEPGTFGNKSLCTLTDNNNKDVIVDITLDKLFDENEAAKFMENYDNKTYREGMSVGVLQYTITGNELTDDQTAKPITNVTFYNDNKEKKFSLNGGDYYIGFFGYSDDTVTNKQSGIVRGYFNYPSDQLPAYVCIGNMDGTQACYKLK